MVVPHRPILIYFAEKQIDTRQQLIDKLQLALMIEFSTIPLYLTALYSIKETANYASRLIRSVVLEEMLHMNLVGNLLTAIGSEPKIKSNPHFPKFPTNLPGQGNPENGSLFLQLLPASVPLIKNVFMMIEEPARRNAPPQDSHYKTIGQFYKAILDGFIRLNGQDPSLFVDSNQKLNYYFGSGGGSPVNVYNLKTAELAIAEIVEQGEGAPASSGAPTEPNENYGLKNAYGYRSDGTYGPVQDGTMEQSHYYKFMEIANGNYRIGPIYPMAGNPSRDRFQNPWAIFLSEIFDACYTIMVGGLERAFASSNPDDPFFSVVFTMMQSVMPPLSVQLMRIPVLSEGDPLVGPNAGPTFGILDLPLTEIIRRVEDAIRQPVSQENVNEITDTLTTVGLALESIREKVKDKHYSFL